MGSSSFPKLRGADGQASRVQDNISQQLQPIADALAQTPIMGAAAPEWLTPYLLADFTNFGGIYAPASFHRDALRYVHGRGLIVTAAGQAIGTQIYILPMGYRPQASQRFVVGGSALASIEVSAKGVVSLNRAVAAGANIDVAFDFLAEG